MKYVEAVTKAVSADTVQAIADSHAGADCRPRKVVKTLCNRYTSGCFSSTAIATCFPDRPRLA